MCHEEGFCVIELPFYAEMLKSQIDGTGWALLLRKGLGGLACLSWTQENHGRNRVQKLPQTIELVFQASMYFNHALGKLHG